MPPSAFLRELAAAGITLTPEPRARLRLTLGSRTLTLTAFPWSARLSRAERQPLGDATPIPDDEPPDIIAEIAQLSRYAADSAAPTVNDHTCLNTIKAIGGEIDGSAWGFLTCTTAHRRAARAHETGHGDLLYDLAVETAHFAAAVVRHHLTPTSQTRREVERCGVSASVLIVAIVRRVTT